MNGRLYDPVIGRFFSPDKYVANSSFTQDFNRYTYARNNPLHYTDPSGNIIWVIGLMEGIAKLMEALNNITFIKKIELPVLEFSTTALLSEAGFMTDGFRGFSASPTFNIGFNLPINLPPPPVQPIDNTAYRPQALTPPPISDGINKPKDMGDLNLPKIPVNDNVLKYFGYGATVLEGLKDFSQMEGRYVSLKTGSKHVPYISTPINVALAYNSAANLWNEPSLEHGYRTVKSATNLIPFYGNFISFTADNFERGATWFANWLTEFEKRLQSNDFWLDLYGY